MRIVAIADTHGVYPLLPDGDVLVHAGDHTMYGSAAEVAGAVDRLAMQSHKTKIMIWGNHDIAAEHHDLYTQMATRAGILVFDGVRETAGIQGVTFWGSPYTPHSGPSQWAFHHPRRREARARWAQIPEKLDVLITHGPPFGIGDRVPSKRHGHVECVGDFHLMQELVTMKAAPRVHLFGHIHCDPGVFRCFDGELQTKFYNVTTDVGRLPATVIDL